MAVCSFFLQGRCKFGDKCKNEHPGVSSGGGGGFQSQNRFSGFSNQGNRGGPARPGSAVRSWPYYLDPGSIKVDLTESFPLWPCSSYGPGRDAPRQLFGGYPVEQSFEEMRMKYYTALAQGNPQPVIDEERQIAQTVKGHVDQILNDLDGACQYVVNGEKEHPNRIDICKESAPTSCKPLSGATPAQTGSSFGTPSGGGGALGTPTVPSAFNKPPTSSPFGQPSPLGTSQQKPAFGAPTQPSPFGARPSPFGQQQPQTGSAFGQPSQPGSAFGRPSAFSSPSALGQGSAFGKPSQPGQATAFGQPSQPGTLSAFSKPSAPGQTSAFGQPSAPGPGSAFGTPSQPGQGISAFGTPSQPGQGGSAFGTPPQPGQGGSAFGTPSQQNQGTSAFSAPSQPVQGASAFGKPSTPNQPSNFGAFTQKPSPFSQQPSSDNAFGVPASSSTNPFAKPATGNAPNTSNPFQAASNTATAGASPFTRQASQPSSAPLTNGGSSSAAPSTFAAPQPNYLQKDASGRVIRFKNQPVQYMSNKPHYEDQPHYKNPQTGDWERMWFPDGPPQGSLTMEDPKESYNDTIREAYEFLAKIGTFKDGIMPEVPPIRDWVRWDI